VKLAPTDDPEKAFNPCKKGIIFGVEYDTENWTWRIPENKLAAINNAIVMACQEGATTVREAQSLIGRLLHIKPLIPSGRFNFHHIMQLSVEANKGTDPCRIIKLPEDTQRQLKFWLSMILLCQADVTIPRVPDHMPPWTLDAFTDAAGGTLDSPGRGTGGVLGEWWYYYPWAKRIAAGGWRIEGVKLGRKLSALELIGPLITLVAARQLIRGRALRIWVDNAGSVAIWKKGYSTSCPLSSSIVTTMAAMAASLNVRVEVVKITRCTGTGAVLADALSKADFEKFRNTAAENNWALNTEPAVITGELLRWLDRPSVDFDLAGKILQEIATTEDVLGYSSITRTR